MLAMGYFGASFFAINTVTENHASAQSQFTADFCIPPVQPVSGGFFEPEGDWLEVRVISRAKIEVRIKDSGQECLSPSGRLITVLTPTAGANSFPQLVNNTLTDRDISDSNFDYRVNQGGETKDDTNISQFGDFPDSATQRIDLGSTFGTVDLPFFSMSPAEIEAFFSTAELTLSIEEDALADEQCSTGVDDNFILATGASPLWVCGDDATEARGIRFANSLVDPQNFNISHTVSDDGRRLIYVSEVNREGLSFLWCEDITANGTYFGIDSCRGNLRIQGETPESLQSKATQDTIPVTVEDITNGNTYSMVLSGATTEAAAETINASTGTRSCESEGGDLSFIVCPLLRITNSAFTTLDGYIIRSLEVDTGITVDGTGDGTGFFSDDSNIRAAWANVRNIAYFMLVPIMLVMVIGTALNFDFISAYTVKRAMPRLVVAVLFMALSFDGLALLVDISNGFGRGTAGLLAAPFGGLDNLTLQKIFNPGLGADAVFVGGVLAAITIPQIGAGALSILASFLFVAIIILLAIFLLLMLRQIAIVFLIIVAPLAILSWIFPGNDGLWKLWWGTFWKLLAIFPLIMGLLVIGRAFASII